VIAFDFVIARSRRNYYIAIARQFKKQIFAKN